jgi:predicted enzyme related to lactoylglutathione lyase
MTGLLGDAIHLAAVRIFVTDLTRSASWYETVVGTAPSAGAPHTGFVVFDVGPHLVLETVDSDSEIPASELIGRFTGLSFAVTEVEATVEALTEHGVSVAGPPERQSWGGTLATLDDPDGNQIQLVQYP